VFSDRTRLFFSSSGGIQTGWDKETTGFRSRIVQGKKKNILQESSTGTTFLKGREPKSGDRRGKKRNSGKDVKKAWGRPSLGKKSKETKSE